MYRRFQFEGTIHETLDCIPLTVRRKLDLAALKISLEGWQKFTRAERLALCHLAVDTPEDLEVYREVLLGIASRWEVPLKPLEHDQVDPTHWRTEHVPEELAARLSSVGLTLSDEQWNALDEETRYALVKLAEPKRHPAKLPALMTELGLGRPGSEEYRPGHNTCERAASTLQ